MRHSAYIRFSLSLVLFVSLLSPTMVLAGNDGKKHFKLGMNAEVSEQWDKAAEEFALAVAENPKNPEYRLHYARAVFNASQMYMKRGTALANEKDYAGAYIAFRKSYGYDPVNELAKSEMERMLRLQQAVQNGENPEEKTIDANGAVKLVSTGYQNTAAPDTVVPQKLERLQDVPFPSGVDLQFLIRELSKSLDLNVLFDTDSRLEGKKIKIELRNVTAAKALDYIFLQEGLFFQKVGPRTILVANQNRRQNYQQLVLRTFYLANADPAEVIKIIQTAIPAQPGRTPTIALVDKSTNSLTVRDTTENIRLIGKLIKSLDKDRAEVVMDVAIYEVTKSDLLQFGTQIGDSGSLVNLGGSNRASVGLFGNNGRSNVSTGANFITQSLGLGLVIPAISFQALQEKRNTNLIASTQIHAFNNEDSSARIGQRVPVRSATISNGFNNAGNTQNNTGGGFVGDVINYEQVGLTLKFKPIVFPNQDVQVTMEIESKDVAGASTLTPTFTERTIKGTARIQNNKTLMLASVAQGIQSNGRTGLPLLGLIPILGRLFTAPTRDNRQVDIVIAITPKVIRAPAILPEDEVERLTGSLATPTSGSLEAMIIQDDIEEQLAAARRLPTVAQVQLPDQKTEEPTYTKSTASQTNASTETITQNQTTAQAPQSSEKSESIINNLRPIDVTAKTLQIAPTADSAENKIGLREISLKTETDAAKSTAPIAEIQFLPGLPAMKAGERTKIAVMVRSATPFRSAVLGMKFDDKKLAVRNVSFGEVFGREMAQTSVNPFFNQAGKTFISLSSPKDTAENSSGILAYIEVEALTEGKHEMAFERDILNFLTADGKNFSIKF
ncbi:MAG: hypothetical protein M3525_06560 [Acidobacteriota bacterium]|nr:hypothetical protein [Acidobacteriota bacterium]